MKCEHCGSENFKTIPAGVSKKTGKPYSAFGKCGDCGKTFNMGGRPATPTNVPPPPDATVQLLSDIKNVLEEINSKIKYEEPPF